MIKTSMQMSDTGMKDFERRVKKLKGSVSIGVFGEKDAEEVIIAATHEFGTDRAGKGHNIKIPQRSFLRATLDEQSDTIRKTVDREKVKIVTGTSSKKGFLERLGLFFVGKVQEKIASGGTPYIENAESTKIQKRRQFPTPLVDEGRLRQAIVHKVNT